MPDGERYWRARVVFCPRPWEAMVPKATKPSDPKDQRERFIAMAKEVGADDDEAIFRTKLGKIVKAPPVEDPRDYPSVKKTKPKKRG